MAFQRVFVDVNGAAGAPPRKAIAHRLDVETDALMSGHNLLENLKLIKADWVPFVIHNNKTRGLITQCRTKVCLFCFEPVFSTDADTDSVAAFRKDVFELREQCPARVREVLEGLAEESQDWIITIHAAPMEDLVQRTQLAWPQTEEVSVLPASPVEDEAQRTRKLPRRTRLIA